MNINAEKDYNEIYNILNKIIQIDEIDKIERLGGLTNFTYYVKVNDSQEYVVRIPGVGTEEMIVRKNEKISTELSCSLGIDAELLYFGADGTKISRYIPNAITMNASELKKKENIKKVADVLKRLHTSGVDTGVPFEVFEMAHEYERIIEDNAVIMFDDYSQIKSKVMKIKKLIDLEYNIKKVPCHNDPLCENWVGGNGKMYLIDWEYAGMNDPMWDIADVSIEADFEADFDLLILNEYLGHIPTEHELIHFYANKVYVDFLWTLWAKARVPYSGQEMEDWALERYARLKNNIIALEKIQGN